MNLHLLIALFLVTGVRPSSILRDGRPHEFDPCQDVDYQKSKLHGRRYGDIELGITRNEKDGEVLGSLTWRILMKFTNQKNSRAMDGGLADLKHIPQDIEHSRCCVVILFVAQHGRLVAEIEKKMDDENERDFEMPELSDDDDDVPRDTETEIGRASYRDRVF